VAYSELQAAGIEFPAGVVAELELAGVEIERCQTAGPGERPVRAVRLRPDMRGLSAPQQRRPERRRAPARTGPGWSDVRLYRASRWGRRRDGWPRAAQDGRAAARRPAAVRAPGAPPDPDAVRAPDLSRSSSRGRTRARTLAPLALLLAVAVVVIAVVTATSGATHRPAPSAGQHASARAHGGRKRQGATRPSSAAGASGGRRQSTSAVTPGTPPLPATRVSPALATALEAHGHSLLAAGDAGAAVPVLERAVAATGERVSACAEPTTQNCLTYAFALFDLGRALELSGHPGQAVAVLEQRLRIDNQRPAVAAQLQNARQG
jgi:hypothetical protein